MAAITPYGQRVGAVKVYLAVYGTAEPALNTTPSGSWVEFGATDGEQSIEFSGGLTVFRDNDHQGPIKVVRAEEDVMVNLTLVNTTLELVSRVLHSVGKLADGVSPVNNRKMPLKRGANPTAYALVMRSDFDSPYGVYPGQTYIPYVVSNAEPTMTHGKDQRVEVECQFMAIEDDAQSEDDKLGWTRVQTS